MNCLSCYKKHLSIAYIYSCLYLKEKQQYYFLRAFGQLNNAKEHARHINRKKLNNIIGLINNIIKNNFEINDNVIQQIYNLYFNA